MAISAAALRRLRSRRDWTQRELAERLDVDPMTVSRWERGLSRPQRSLGNRIEALIAAAKSEMQPKRARVAKHRRPRPAHERIDELVRIVGLAPALKALRQIALLERRPVPVRFADEPAKRLREVERALREQTALITRAKLR